MNLSRTLQKTFMKLKYLLILALISGGGIPTPASADNGNIPLDLQAKLFLTALTYDKKKHIFLKSTETRCSRNYFYYQRYGGGME